MFRTAAKKIAHNSTLPVLGGNKDLRTLQDLITAEKAVLNSLQKLSADVAKASEALKTWGLGEGEDLGDILSASCALLLHFAEALSNYAAHEVPVREHMKSVRTREERLDELRRRRKSVVSESESAERKLSKMGPDNKNLQAQTDNLNKLREEIRIMDTDILAEEASLSDYKRSSAKAWMGLKFGGLAECSEKGMIIGEVGKQVIVEMPMETTEPGLTRAAYQGHAQTESLVSEARRALSEVVFSHEPGRSRRSGYSADLSGFPLTQHRQSGTNQFGPTGNSSRRTSMSMPVPSMDENSSRLSQVLRSPTTTSYLGSPQSPFMHPNVQSLSYEHLQSSMPPGDSLDFGVLPPEAYSLRATTMRSPDERERLGGPRTRFSTLPGKAVGPRPPPSGRNSQLYDALPLRGDDRAPSLDIGRPSDDFSSSVAEALGQHLGESQGTSLSAITTDPLDRKGGSLETEPRSYSPPPPKYTAVGGPPQFEPKGGEDETADVQLAYMAPTESEPEPSLTREDRRVAFEGSPEPGSEETKVEDESSAGTSHEREGATGIQGSDTSRTNVSGEGSGSDQPESSDTQPSLDGERQVPDTSEIPLPPPREPSPINDEKSLNAAAAREVSRELDALMFNTADDRTPSPLQPPQAPFTMRSVSPRPNLELSTSQPTSPRMGPQYVRARDRSLASPGSISSISHSDHNSALPPSRLSGERESPSPTVPAITVAQSSPSPAPSAISTNFSTPYRTPPEYMSPTGAPPNSSFYNLSSVGTGSGASFTSSGGGKISAAAFRRQQMRSPSAPSVDNGPGGADVSPLVVKKRPMPPSPGPYQSPWAGQGTQRTPSAPMMSGSIQDASEGPTSRYRSASAVRAGESDAGSRMSKSSGRSPTRHEGAGSDDDYDYISAYTNAPDNDGPAEDGYGKGRFTTNLEDSSNGGLR